MITWMTFQMAVGMYAPRGTKTVRTLLPRREF